MYKLTISFLLILCSVSEINYAQTSQFKTYTDNKNKFSVDIPASWAINYSKQEYGFICVPVTNVEKAKYKECFEGIVFRLSTSTSGLDAALTNDGYTKTGNNYFTSDKVSGNIKADNITGKSWTGIYHNNTCGIMCKGKPSTGKCQFIYFSNGKSTVSFATNGKEFPAGVLDRIKSSFRFL